MLISDGGDPGPVDPIRPSLNDNDAPVDGRYASRNGTPHQTMETKDWIVTGRDDEAASSQVDHAIYPAC